MFYVYKTNTLPVVSIFLRLQKLLKNEKCIKVLINWVKFVTEK